LGTFFCQARLGSRPAIQAALSLAKLEPGAPKHPQAAAWTRERELSKLPAQMPDEQMQLAIGCAALKAAAKKIPRTLAFSRLMIYQMK
jgi:hypothetical protein